MRDIDYFSKSRMVGKTRNTYVNELPSHLRSLFLEAETENGGFISGDNCLKNYEAHSPSNGIKEITCRWDIAVEAMGHASRRALGGFFGTIFEVVVAPVTLVTVGTANLVTERNSSISLYFDAATGEMLDENDANERGNKNEAAKKHFEKGKSHERNENFRAAHGEYQKAYKGCSNNYTNKSTFKSYRDISAQKYKNAIIQSKINEETNIYIDMAAKAKKEVHAGNLKNEGDQHTKVDQLKESSQKYIEAEAQSEVNKSSYAILNNDTAAKIEADAADKVESGKNFLDNGDLDSAKREFDDAIQMTRSEERKGEYEKMLAKVMNSIDNQGETVNDYSERIADNLQKNEQQKVVTLLQSKTD